MGPNTAGAELFKNKLTNDLVLGRIVKSFWKEFERTFFPKVSLKKKKVRK